MSYKKLVKINNSKIKKKFLLNFFIFLKLLLKSNKQSPASIGSPLCPHLALHFHCPLPVYQMVKYILFSAIILI